MSKTGLVAIVGLGLLALIYLEQQTPPNGGRTSSGGATFTYRGFSVTVDPGGEGGMVEATWKWRDASGVVQTGIVDGDNLVDVTASAHAAIDYIVTAEGATPA